MDRSVPSRSKWFLIGALAGIAAQAVMLLARLVLGAPSFAEVLSDWALSLMPGALAGFIIDRLQFLAKPSLFILLVLGQVLLAGLIGIGFGQRAADETDLAGEPDWQTAGVIGGALAILAFLIEIASGSYGAYSSATIGGTFGVVFVLVASFAAFAAVLAGIGQLAATAGPEGTPGTDAGRRQLITGVVSAAAVIVAGGSIARIIGTMGEQGTVAGASAATAAAGPATGAPGRTAASAPPATSVGTPAGSTAMTPASAATSTVAGATPSQAATNDSPAVGGAGSPSAAGSGAPKLVFPPGESALITPVDKFYVVSKNFVDPNVDVSHWVLEITGLVSKPTKLTLPDLLKYPAVNRYLTLECISNTVGGNLISDGQWSGVLLTTLLKDVGISPSARAVVWTAADGFTESIPLNVAMDGWSMLAHSLEGKLLTAKHGAPTRVFLQNRYGMKQPKWLTKIELAATSIDGYWERQGWSDQAIVLTNSRIDVPNGGSFPVGKPLPVAGIAFAGARGISKVEVSVDDGRTWAPAQLEPALSMTTWVRWLYTWKPTKAGDYTLRVRATDGTNALQDPKTTDSYPNGATGLDQKAIRVG